MQQFRKFEFISRIFLKYKQLQLQLHWGSAEGKIGLSDKLATSTKTDGLYLNVDWIYRKQLQTIREIKQMVELALNERKRGTQS